eukprot:TRINITY_DN1151_c0_g1_i1.p1 TRINITY_DN1151_c0_g1~~TRINITY_DN1151_c0_g1_i1.p1  ORF type:complete len:674 (+),score=124.84 TRINITY_DN1151_c0_g1_i1:134-2155(+)
MGFLHESTPLTWQQTMAHLKYVRAHGIEQFLAIYESCNKSIDSPFRWGDEVEHQLFSLVGDDQEDGRSAKVSLRSPEVMKDLQEAEATAAGGSCAWMPEYGRWMLESTPGRPYDGLDGIALVEQQLRLRRQRLDAQLLPGEVAPTVTAFPLFGVGDFCEPSYAPRGPFMDSLFVPDEVIFPHPRFPTLAKHIRERRGSKVAIRRPLFQDVATRPSATASSPADAVVPHSVEAADALDHIYADAMAFGMGSSCLQVTLQASSISESRHLYDQLAPLTPLLLALTAATPFLRGWICDDDARWGQISQSVDCRTDAERGLTSEAAGDERLAGAGVRELRQARYGTIDCYIGEDASTASYNDLPMAMDQEHLERLKHAGLDDTLARHVAHLFARDPLVVFGDRLQLDDAQEVDHWENLQSTNWQSMRWKPPPPQRGVLSSSDDSHVGWRVEFRTMEVQLTDFENAAFISFVVLLSRVILDEHIDLRIPISKLEENMSASQRRDAYTQERFWFRTNTLASASADEGQYRQLTLKEIMCGTDDFRGLIALCLDYVSKSTWGVTRAKLALYLEFIAKRAAGELRSGAACMREFVTSHPAYKQDSRVPAEAAHDLLREVTRLGRGETRCPQLVGDFVERAAKVEKQVLSCTSCSSAWGAGRRAAGAHSCPIGWCQPAACCA